MGRGMRETLEKSVRRPFNDGQRLKGRKRGSELEQCQLR